LKLQELRSWIRRVRSFVQGIDSATSWRLLGGVIALRVFRIRGVTVPAAGSGTASIAGSTRLPRIVPVPTQRGEHIPAVIFQTWKTRTSLPDNYAYWSRSFRDLNPQYQYILWDDADNREFIAEDFPWFLEFYASYPAEIFRADMVRFFFLFRFGGLYSDLDTQCLQPVAEVLAGKHVVLGRMSWKENFTQAIPNAMMASRPGELFWLLAIAIAIEKHASLNTGRAQVEQLPEHFTGPSIVKESVAFWRSSDVESVRNRASKVLLALNDRYPVQAGDLTVLPIEEWYPINWSNPVHAEFRESLLRERCIPTNAHMKFLFPRSSLVTFWTHSW